MGPTVTISEHGRAGHVTYRESSGEIAGYWEFGGRDVVAIVAMGSADDWRTRHPWAVGRRAEILRVVADEVIRRRAPSCTASIDETSGDILLRVGAVADRAPNARAAGTPWVRRYGSLKGWLGAIGLLAAALAGVAAWVTSRVLVVQTGTGVPFGSTLRTDTHLATLIDWLQPYTPSLHRDPSRDRRTLSLFLVPLDGSTPRLVPLARDLRPSSYSLARVIGSDGRRMWVDVGGPIAIDLHTYEPVTGAEPPRPAARPLSHPPLTFVMAAGLILDDGTWLGLQSEADLSSSHRPGRWLRPVESASDTPRETRRLTRGVLGPGSRDERHRQIRSMAPIDERPYRNASFLRLSDTSEPLRVGDPDSVLMLHASGEGLGGHGTLLVSRVATADGRLLWTQDTGLDRFTLAQVLPGERSTAFVGARPPIPDTVSEPLIVLLDHATGRLATHSLWR